MIQKYLDGRYRAVKEKKTKIDRGQQTSSLAVGIHHNFYMFKTTVLNM